MQIRDENSHHERFLFIASHVYSLNSDTVGNSLRRLTVVCIATAELSIPIHRLPRISAAMSVVPDPEKQSSTISPGFEDALIIRLSN